MQSSDRDEGRVSVDADGVSLDGNLLVPKNARGVVVFAHGTGGSRFSSRNRYVAEVLRGGGMGTLLLDLLTHDEERVDDRTAQLRFDIDMLAARIVGTVSWIREQRDYGHLPIGLFGASTGAAAALVAAADRPAMVSAVVSRGGRPDLAGPVLHRVHTPTLLIVGGDDTAVIELNRRALDRLACIKQLAIVPRATHLFEEPGTLERVSDLALEWFAQYVVAGARHAQPVGSR